jgi:hypothetical protein
MRLTRHLFAITLVAGALLAAALAPAVTPRASKRSVTKATPTVARISAPARVSEARQATLRVRHAARIATTKRIAAPAPAQAGMVVAVDPESGQLGMPTAEQLEALGVSNNLALDDSDAGLVQVVHPNGSVGVDLQGRFQEYSVIRITSDGRRVVECTPTRKEAARLMLTPVPARALEEK